ncbi:IQ domain-containing protein E [Toxocara canis]|uniref:IQ domain-containing protein E n=1 Tax=Toxocara canis TaxID=6265 RepID=A0A0B2UT60_TOXCA|nr:IQ domain-containing protein E [Toxocara canis]
MDYTGRTSTSGGVSGLKRAHLPNGLRSVITRAERFSASSSNGKERWHNSIDRGEDNEHAHTLQLYPTTSAGALDRRELLRKVYGSNSAKASIKNNSKLMTEPSSTTLVPLALNSNLRNRASSMYASRDQYGRSPNHERVDDLKQELLNMKRNYAIILKENSVLKTRLKRYASESAKKDRQLQDVLLNQSRSLTNTEHQAVINSLKQKLVKYEALIREKSDEINRLKDDRNAMKISDLREQIFSLENECTRLRKCLNSAAPLSRQGQTFLHQEQVKNLKAVIDKLKGENERLESRLAKIRRDSETTAESLSSCSRADLIALVARLQIEIKRRDAVRSQRITSGRMRKEDRSLIANAQQVAKLTKELDKARQLIKAKSVIVEKLRKDMKAFASQKNTNNKTQKRISNGRNQMRDGNGAKKQNVIDSHTVVKRNNSRKCTMNSTQMPNRNLTVSSPSPTDERDDAPSPTESGESTDQNATTSEASTSRTESEEQSEKRETCSANTHRSTSESSTDSCCKKAEALRMTNAAKTIQKQWRYHNKHLCEARNRTSSCSLRATAQTSSPSEEVEAFVQKRAAKTIQKQWRSYKDDIASAPGSDVDKNITGAMKEAAKGVKNGHVSDEDNNDSEGEQKKALDFIIDAASSHFTRLRLLERKSAQFHHM